MQTQITAKIFFPYYKIHSFIDILELGDFLTTVSCLPLNNVEF